MSWHNLDNFSVFTNLWLPGNVVGIFTSFFYEQTIDIISFCCGYHYDRLLRIGDDLLLGATDGSANLTVTGGDPPYTFTWMNASLDTVGTNSSSIGSLSAGNYSIAVVE